MMKPETVTLAFSEPDGNVVIMGFVTRGAINAAGDIFEAEPTEENVLAEIRRSGYQADSFVMIDPASLPSEDDRAAWRIVDGKVIVPAA